MIYGDSLSSLSLANSVSGGFPYPVEHMAGGGPGQPAHAVRPIIHVYRACAVYRCVLVRIMAAYIYSSAILFMRDSGCSLSYSLHPESQSANKNSALR